MNVGPALRCGAAQLAVSLLLAATTAHAQCPDGTPPPCRGSSRSTASRSSNPALKERTWIVMPFTNVTRATDLDWLRDGSVNLLTLDMGRWTDVDVVPDKRVADLVRETIAQRGSGALTLNDGIEVAKRAGAGRLVMGDFIKIGSGARLVATVFDVKTGAKVRTATRQTANADSLLTAFGPLSRELLAVPPPADAKIGEIGTQSLDAYRLYLQGVKALNRFDLPEARQQLTRALATDSTFALAHLEFANMLEWGDAGATDLARQHARAAERLGANLPRREKMLIDAGVASAEKNYSRLCQIAHSLVTQDSTDIQGVFLLGECSFHNDSVVVSSADTTVGTFQGSWPTAMRSFQRVIELDPTYLGAFEHIIQMLMRQRRLVCTRAACAWESYVLRSGDTLETIPARPESNALYQELVRFRNEKPARKNHTQLEEIAQRWVDLDSTSEGARVGRALAATANGNLAVASENLRHVPPRASVDNLDPLLLKIEVAAKLGRGAEARAAFDSIVRVIPDNPSIDVQRGAIELMFGRFTRFDRGMVAAAKNRQPEAAVYQKEVGRALLGFPREAMIPAEAAFLQSMRNPACDVGCKMAQLDATVAFSPHAIAAPLPPITVDSVDDDLAEPTLALSAHDTTWLRRSARRLDSIGHARTNDQLLDPRTFVAALAYLALGDSSSALRSVRFFVDSSMVFLSIRSQFITGLVGLASEPLWPRAMLLRADLEATRGNKNDAKVWYDRVLDLWSNADPDLQPMLDRIKRSRAALDK